MAAWLVLAGHNAWANVPNTSTSAAPGTSRPAPDARRLAEVDRLLKSRPDDPSLHLERGQLLWQAGRANDALNAFRRVLKVAPQSAAAHNNMAVILASQGRFDEARQSLEMALKTHDAYATIHENMGQLYAHMAGEAYRRALNADKAARPSSAPQLALVVSTDVPPRPESAPLAQPKAPTPPVVLVENPIVSPPPKPEVPALPPPTAPSPPPPATPSTPQTPLPATRPSVPPLPPAPATPPSPGSATAPSPAPAPSPAAAPAAPTPPPAANRPGDTGRPAVSPSAGEETPSIARTALNAWADAWSRQDMRAYAAAYRPDFKGSQRSHAEWLEQRRQRIEPRKRIEVEVSDIRAERRGAEIEVSFRQIYTSDGMTVRSRKNITLERVGERWLISAESGR